MKAKVFITLKKAVLDPQGKAVEGTLQRLGYSNVESVRVGKYVEIDVVAENADDAQKQVADMCEKLIANTVIEDYRIEVES